MELRFPEWPQVRRAKTVSVGEYSARCRCFKTWECLRPNAICDRCAASLPFHGRGGCRDCVRTIGFSFVKGEVVCLLFRCREQIMAATARGGLGDKAAAISPSGRPHDTWPNQEDRYNQHENYFLAGGAMLMSHDSLRTWTAALLCCFPSRTLFLLKARPSRPGPRIIRKSCGSSVGS